MNTKHGRTKSTIGALGAAVAALAAPAMLFLGTGTAQAMATVSTTTDAAGVTVHIQSNDRYGWCEYSAIPFNPPPGVLPVLHVPFYLQKGANHDLWFPGIQTGTKWNTFVICDNGPDVTSTDITVVTY